LNSLKANKKKLNPLSQAYELKQNKKFHQNVEEQQKPTPKANDSFSLNSIVYDVNPDRIIAEEDTRTTLMIKNIPNKYSIQILKEEFDESFNNNYNFLYLPIDSVNRCNKGYAFINIINYQKILLLLSLFQGKAWKNFQSLKKCEFSYAKIQGLIDLRVLFEKSFIINNKIQDNQPLFITSPQETQAFQIEKTKRSINI